MGREAVSRRPAASAIHISFSRASGGRAPRASCQALRTHARARPSSHVRLSSRACASPAAQAGWLSGLHAALGNYAAGQHAARGPYARCWACAHGHKISDEQPGSLASIRIASHECRVASLPQCLDQSRLANTPGGASLSPKPEIQHPWPPAHRCLNKCGGNPRYRFWCACMQTHTPNFTGQNTTETMGGGMLPRDIQPLTWGGP